MTFGTNLFYNKIFPEFLFWIEMAFSVKYGIYKSFFDEKPMNFVQIAQAGSWLRDNICIGLLWL